MSELSKLIVKLDIKEGKVRLVENIASVGGGNFLGTANEALALSQELKMVAAALAEAQRRQRELRRADFLCKGMDILRHMPSFNKVSFLSGSVQVLTDGVCGTGAGDALIDMNWNVDRHHDGEAWTFEQGLDDISHEQSCRKAVRQIEDAAVKIFELPVDVDVDGLLNRARMLLLGTDEIDDGEDDYEDDDNGDGFGLERKI